MDLVAIAEASMKVILLLALPSLMVSLVVGLIISIFQAVTQVNDMALAFVPKIILVMATIVLTLPWMIEIMREYAGDLFAMILEYGS